MSTSVLKLGSKYYTIHIVISKKDDEGIPYPVHTSESTVESMEAIKMILAAARRDCVDMEANLDYIIAECTVTELHSEAGGVFQYMTTKTVKAMTEAANPDQVKH